MLYEAINPGGTDWQEFARTATERVSAGLRHVMGSPVIDDPRIIHLHFSTLVASPVETIRMIYERSGLPYSDEFEAHMRAWLAAPENRSDRYGRYDYPYEPYGIDQGWLRTQFAAYRERFCTVAGATI